MQGFYESVGCIAAVQGWEAGRKATLTGCVWLYSQNIQPAVDRSSQKRPSHIRKRTGLKWSCVVDSMCPWSWNHSEITSLHLLDLAYWSLHPFPQPRIQILHPVTAPEVVCSAVQKPCAKRNYARHIIPKLCYIFRPHRPFAPNDSEVNLLQS